MAWNRPSGSETKRTQERLRRNKCNLIFRLALVGIGVALVGLLVWFFATDSDRAPSDHTKQRVKIREATPQIPKRMAEFEKAKPSTKMIDSGETNNVPSPLKDFQLSPTNFNCSIITMAVDMAFSNPVERVMADLLQTIPGEMPPLVPMIVGDDEATLKKSIGRMYEVKADDDDATADRKDIVNAAKKELKRYFDEGGTVNDFLQYYQRELVDMFEYREECRSVINKSIRNEDPEIAAAFFKQINEKLTEKGIKPVELNPKQKLRIGLQEDN